MKVSLSAGIFERYSFLLKFLVYLWLDILKRAMLIAIGFVFLVEQRKQPNLRGLPTAVVQYNSWKGGGLIAVSYEARKFGVKR